MASDPILNEPDVTAQSPGDDGLIPNNPHLPILIYKSAVDLSGSGDPASVFERLFASNQWDRSWRNGIYSFPHYHSTAHECLGIARGTATVRLGGSEGFDVVVAPGDVAILPAGAGHEDLGQSPDLLVVGCYPPGPDWDLCRSPGDHDDAVLSIAHVPLPPCDPVYGTDGPLFEHWT